MQKLIYFIILILSTMFARAQTCTTLWPYVYPEFMEGTLYFADEQKLNAQFNIHVQESRLHYLEKGKIMEALNKDIILVTIGTDKYMVVDGSVMKVVGSEERGFVATLILGDFKSLVETSGAYGTTTTSSSVMQLSSIEVGGKSIVDHMNLKNRRNEGTPLSLIRKYFVVTKGEVYPASRRAISKKLDKQRATEFKAFVKKHKIDWENPASIIQVLDFFNP